MKMTQEELRVALIEAYGTQRGQNIWASYYSWRKPESIRLFDQDAKVLGVKEEDR